MEKYITLDNGHEKTCFIQPEQIGEGAFGSVNLCKNINTGVYMAMNKLISAFNIKNSQNK